MYIIRLDDASEYMDVGKWKQMETILDKYKIKPIVGIIPNNKDVSFIKQYDLDLGFWDKARLWESKQWTIALHGFTHVYLSNNGGINPVNLRSEFAGVSLKEQKIKIASGIKIFKEKGLNAKVFFAPAHTFDMKTLEALQLESDIKIISDTIANDVYKRGGFYFIPQQSGKVRRLPFKTTTFCYHPNIMKTCDFEELEYFIKKHRSKFIMFEDLTFKDRCCTVYDKALQKLYFLVRVVRNRLKGE